MALQTLPPTASKEEMVAALQTDGAAIVKDVIDPQVVKQMTDEVLPYINATPMGRDDFTGRLTQRTGALVARTPTCRDLIMHPEILGAAREFLGPYADKIILHLTQTIHINPGNPAQPLHRDRLAWGKYIPPSIEPQFNTIWALTDFTAENGATRCVPGSHTWDHKKHAEPDQIVQAEMSAGSVFLYTGSVLHSGGENRSDTSRLGLNLTYTLGWLRQEENQYLSCPPSIAKTLEPELQDLLGYTQGTYALGYFSDPESTHENSDILPPEVVLGRLPTKGSSLGSIGFETLDFADKEQL
ncbi:MAG: ectoine hydroxylase-related dioxygenase (phytanoyl-CoA dioxygenase family) [Limisphaerales bacterium]|jgi:ectoine hydroxylase-related dioxygenase (phytanoyl-CoA dioxygenase family)